MQEILSQNPELNNESMTFSNIIRKNDKLANKENLFQQCRKILLKSYQSRTTVDNNTVLKLIEKSQFLKDIMQFQGLDFLKGILRNAKLQIVNEKQIIIQESQPINYMVIVLQGKLGIQKPSMIFVDQQSHKTINENKQKEETIDQQTIKINGLLQKLTILAKRQRDLQRKTSKLQRKSTMPASQYDLMLPVLTNDDYQTALENLQGKVLLNDELGGKLRLNHTSYPSRVFAIEKTTLLVLQINFLFYWLQVSYKMKMNKNIEKMKLLPAFDVIQEEEKIADIILGMKLVKRKKGDIIYHQGDYAQMLYLLTQGELKITKEANLFKENPNDLYVDRRRLSHYLKRNEPIYALSKNKHSQNVVLPFANLTSLYNYRPMKKLIQIGVFSSYGIFGAEELIFKTQRQTSITVNSLQASFYQIQFKKILQILGPKLSQTFKSKLQLSLSKAILYRQKQFADNIRLQNRSNLDYFYLEQNHSKQSPRKFKLDKLNQKLVPNKSQDIKDHAPAFYTTFNFNKIFSSSKSRYNLSSQIKKSKNQYTEEDAVDIQHNEKEEKILQISHSWTPMEKKVRQQNQTSKKISPFKHKINIHEPLIDQQFFKDVENQNRRINKLFRNTKLSLGKRPK